MQGISLKPILLGKEPEKDRESLYFHYYEDIPPDGFPKHEGIFDGRFKLIHFYTTDAWEFYDLEKDPLEVQNLYTDESIQGKIHTLQQDLIHIKEKYRL